MSLIHSHNTSKKFHSFIHSLAQPFFGRAMEIGCRTQGKGTNIVLASYAFFPSFIRSKMDMEIFHLDFLFPFHFRISTLCRKYGFSPSFLNTSKCVLIASRHIHHFSYLSIVFSFYRLMEIERNRCEAFAPPPPLTTIIIYLYLFGLWLKRRSWCVAPMGQN